MSVLIRAELPQVHLPWFHPLPPENMLVREKVGDFGSVVAAGAAGRDATLNEVGRVVGSVVAVGATETVCVLHAGVPDCLTGFSLVCRVWVKNDWNELSRCYLYSGSLSLQNAPPLRTLRSCGRFVRADAHKWLCVYVCMCVCVCVCEWVFVYLCARFPLAVCSVCAVWPFVCLFSCRQTSLQSWRANVVLFVQCGHSCRAARRVFRMPRPCGRFHAADAFNPRTLISNSDPTERKLPGLPLRRSKRFHPTVRKQTYIRVTLLWENKHTFLCFSPTQKIDHFLTHAHALSESSCTAVWKNTNTACQLAATYTTDCGTTCALSAYAKHKLGNFRRRRHAPEFPGVAGRFWAQMKPRCTYQMYVYFSVYIYIHICWYV